MLASVEQQELNPITTTRRGGLEGNHAVNMEMLAAGVEQILRAVGEDPDRDGLRDTPRRVAKAYAELLRGHFQSPADHLARVFEQEHAGAVILRDIPFFSLCEHHMLPFVGKASIAYRPGGGQIVGLSKLARTVDVFARRLQVQERLTDQIADAIDRHLMPQGVAVLVEAEHFCMKMRGVNKCGSSMITTAMRGCFKVDPEQRREVMDLLRGR